MIKIELTEEALTDLINMFNRKLNSHITFHSARIENNKILISSSTMYNMELIKNEEAIVIPFSKI